MFVGVHQTIMLSDCLVEQLDCCLSSVLQSHSASMLTTSSLTCFLSCSFFWCLRCTRSFSMFEHVLLVGTYLLFVCKDWRSQSGGPGMLNALAANNSWSSGSPDDPTYSQIQPRIVYTQKQQGEAQQQQQQQQAASGVQLSRSAVPQRTGELPTPPMQSAPAPAVSPAVDPSALYATVNKPSHQAAPVQDERPQSASPMSTDSSTTTTSTSSSDADAAMAGLVISQHASAVEGRENPFNKVSSLPESPGVATGQDSSMSGSGWQPSALPEQFQANVSSDLVPSFHETVESAADGRNLEPSPQVTEQAMSLTSLSALHSGLVAPSTTPAVPGMLDTTAADAAMAVAMAAAATLGEAVNVDELDEPLLELDRSPSQSSMLSDLSDT